LNLSMVFEPRAWLLRVYLSLRAVFARRGEAIDRSMIETQRFQFAGGVGVDTRPVWRLARFFGFKEDFLVLGSKSTRSNAATAVALNSSRIDDSSAIYFLHNLESKALGAIVE
jgi:hypothetical protein